MVLPQWVRRDLVAAPGEVVLRRTADGVLLTPSAPAGELSRAQDGLPVLRLGRPISNDEVLAAIDEERGGR